MIISANKAIEQFDKKFEKLASKLLKRIDFKTYFNTFSKYNISVQEGDADLNVASNSFAFISTRKTIVDTLKELGYRRLENEWTEKVVAAFIDEVINLYLYEHNETIIAAESVEISQRYNVPVARLKNQVALFLVGYHRDKDNYKISSYFSPYEIALWEYRDVERLQKLIEDGKLRPSDRKLLKDLQIIE